MSLPIDNGTLLRIKGNSLMCIFLLCCLGVNIKMDFTQDRLSADTAKFAAGYDVSVLYLRVSLAYFSNSYSAPPRIISKPCRPFAFLSTTLLTQMRFVSWACAESK